MIKLSSRCHKKVGTLPQRRHYSSSLNRRPSESYSSKDNQSIRNLKKNIIKQKNKNINLKYKPISLAPQTNIFTSTI